MHVHVQELGATPTEHTTRVVFASSGLILDGQEQVQLQQGSTAAATLPDAGSWLFPAGRPSWLFPAGRPLPPQQQPCTAPPPANPASGQKSVGAGAAGRSDGQGIPSLRGLGGSRQLSWVNDVNWRGLQAEREAEILRVRVAKRAGARVLFTSFDSAADRPSGGAHVVERQAVSAGAPMHHGHAATGEDEALLG